MPRCVDHPQLTAHGGFPGGQALAGRVVEGDGAEVSRLGEAVALDDGDAALPPAVLYGVMAGAAGSDPEIAEMYRRQQQARYTDQRRVARSLSRKGALRAGLSEARATDIMWAIANPSTHRSLIGERGWATGEYERWLAQVLISALLEQPGTA